MNFRASSALLFLDEQRGNCYATIFHSDRSGNSGCISLCVALDGVQTGRDGDALACMLPAFSWQIDDGQIAAAPTAKEPTHRRAAFHPPCDREKSGLLSPLS